MKDLKSIVVATDFSPIADHALEEALDLAERLGAAITLVHAYEIPVYAFPDGILVASADVTAGLQESAQKHLARVVDQHKARRIPITPVLRMGAPWEEINTVAKETSAGLIVAGTHGRRGLSRALLGSVAERLIRTSSLPVLIVHA